MYARRPIAFDQQPQLAERACWLLPAWGIRVSRWIPEPNATWDGEDFYVDIGQINVEGDSWQLIDHYLDIVVYTEQRAEVVDIDEFVAAVRAGHLDAFDAERALHTTYQTLDGIAAHGYDLQAWLATSADIRLHWP